MIYKLKSQLTSSVSWLLQYKQNKKREPFDSPENPPKLYKLLIYLFKYCSVII